MKTKLTLLLLALLISGSTFAQHINFMGIPLSGTLEEFADKMENKGFKKVSKTSMKGNFGGYYCSLQLSSNNSLSKKDDIIASVKVRFNEYQTSSPDIFHNLSKWLTVKYGRYEEYPDHYIKEEFGYKVCMCRVWCTADGTIVLHYGQDVELSYIDRIRSISGNDNEILNDL